MLLILKKKDAGKQWITSRPDGLWQVLACRHKDGDSRKKRQNAIDYICIKNEKVSFLLLCIILNNEPHIDIFDIVPNKGQY